MINIGANIYIFCFLSIARHHQSIFLAISHLIFIITFSFQSQRKAMPKNAQTTPQLHSSHISKVMLKILQARLQVYLNCKLPDVQAGFRKGRGTRDQIANIHWIIEKAR